MVFGWRGVGEAGLHPQTPVSRQETQLGARQKHIPGISTALAVTRSLRKRDQQAQRPQAGPDQSLEDRKGPMWLQQGGELRMYGLRMESKEGLSR